MTAIQHRDITGPDRIHECIHYIQDNDPGQVGPGKYWRTLTAPVILRVRDPSDAGWYVVGLSPTGSTTITTLGTITSGVWHGTAVDAAHIGPHSSTHKDGGSDEIATTLAAAGAIPKAGGGGTLAFGWFPVGTISSTLCAGDDSRLSNARTPVGTSLSSGFLWIGNGSNLAAAVGMSGDVTISNGGVTTIGAGRVTASMLAGSIPYSKLVGTDIVGVGVVVAGVWNAQKITVTYGGTGSDLSATGPGLIHQASPGSALTILTNTIGMLSNDGSGNLSYISTPVVYGGTGTDLSVAGPGVVIQTAMGGVFSVLVDPGGGVYYLRTSGGTMSWTNPLTLGAPITGASVQGVLYVDGGPQLAQVTGTNGQVLFQIAGAPAYGDADTGGYTATTSSDWSGSPPTTIRDALDRCAALLKTLNGGTGP